MGNDGDREYSSPYKESYSGQEPDDRDRYGNPTYDREEDKQMFNNPLIDLIYIYKIILIIILLL